MIEDYKVYFEELQKKLFPVIIVFVVGLLGGFLFSNKILVFCLKLFNFSGVNVMVTSPTQLIDLSIYTALLCGFILTIPFLTYQIIAFVKPAFKEQEYRLVKTMLPFALILFIIGSIFGAWVTQFVITFFSKYSADFQVSNMWDIQKFFFQVVITAFLTGLIFETPIILTILIRIGLLKRQLLIDKRRYVYAILLIVAVILPSTDILSLVLLLTPLLFLFEITLLLNMDRP